MLTVEVLLDHIKYHCILHVLFTALDVDELCKPVSLEASFENSHVYTVDVKFNKNFFGLYGKELLEVAFALYFEPQGVYGYANGM